MTLPYEKRREILLQFLCTQDYCTEDVEELFDLLMPLLRISKKNLYLVREDYLQMMPFLPEIDKVIAEKSEDYHFDRITSVEKNILRLAYYEIQYLKKAPETLLISEAIRLSKKFSHPDSAQFIHAVLRKLFPLETPVEEVLV